MCDSTLWAADGPGTLVLAVGVGLLSGEINEAAMSYAQERVRFLKPVCIGDTIRSRAAVSALRPHPKNPSHLVL